MQLRAVALTLVAVDMNTKCASDGVLLLRDVASARDWGERNTACTEVRKASDKVVSMHRRVLGCPFTCQLSG